MKREREKKKKYKTTRVQNKIIKYDGRNAPTCQIFIEPSNNRLNLSTIYLNCVLYAQYSTHVQYMPRIYPYKCSFLVYNIIRPHAHNRAITLA